MMGGLCLLGCMIIFTLVNIYTKQIQVDSYVRVSWRYQVSTMGSLPAALLTLILMKKEEKRKLFQLSTGLALLGLGLTFVITTTCINLSLDNTTFAHAVLLAQVHSIILVSARYLLSFGRPSAVVRAVGRVLRCKRKEGKRESGGRVSGSEQYEDDADDLLLLISSSSSSSSSLTDANESEEGEKVVVGRYHVEEESDKEGAGWKGDDISTSTTVAAVTVQDEHASPPPRQSLSQSRQSIDTATLAKGGEEVNGYLTDSPTPTSTSTASLEKGGGGDVSKTAVFASLSPPLPTKGGSEKERSNSRPLCDRPSLVEL
eukprot:CAMPEP_0113901098 /NCGR_PEP_ID=MMETSP0780_2-20120614/21057_1 /TAXON_ID=652834 /ORGANISM="Palpitomonas bilix" /LENGTH=315 /DNA_ID=CAMNT_0000893657 /DNA_START=516 /DNA_END=1460 /DNA_ORIENTATION=+ /assembly_acc=CAM_ASM_000599